MNFADISKYSALLKYSKLTPQELTTGIVTEIATALGYKIEIGEGVLGEVVNLVNSENIEKLADLMGHPAVLAKLKILFDAQSGKDDNLIICPHCNEYINIQGD